LGVSSLLFFCVNGINVLTFLMFVSRVKMPQLASPFGMATILIAIPLLFLGVVNLLQRGSILSWVPLFSYAGWALFALMVDYVWKVEFRNPVNPWILVPFLVLFYGSIVGMGLNFWRIHFFFWIITACTSVLNVLGSIYAGLHGKG